MATLSVLINCFNYGRYVVEAIESVLAQTILPDEILVVDDGSTDDTPEILEDRYSAHSIVKVLRQRNGGHMSAFVLGMENAMGDILFFLDADDKYEPDHLEKVEAVFANNKDVDFVFTAHRQFGDGNRVVQYAPQDLKFGFSVIATLKERVFIGSITSTIAIRRNISLILLPVLRHIAPRWRMRAEDCIVYGASLAGAKKYYLANPTALYRFHNTNEHRFGAMTELDESYRHGLRRDSFSQLLCDHLGLGPSTRFGVASEFLSSQQPIRNQYRTYLRLNCRIHGWSMDGFKGRIKMYLHYKRNRPTWDISKPADFHG